MGFSVGMVWEVRDTGSDSNGGGFRGGSILTIPSAPTVSGSGTGGTVAANTYYVVVTLVDGNGETPKSAETSVTTTGTTSSITVTYPTDPVSQGSTWNVYVGTTSGGPYFSQGAGLTFTTNRSVTTTPPTTGTQAPGVDYSQQDAPQVTYADLVIGGTNTTATSAANPFTPSHVGNLLNVTGGTGFTVQRCEVTGVTAGVATFDKALGTASSTGGTGKLGGAFASPAMPGALAVSSNIVYIKYNSTSYVCLSSNNVSGGSFNSSNNLIIVGYDTTRTIDNTDANRPTLDAGAASMVVIQANGNGVVANLIVTNSASRASVSGMYIGGRCVNLKVVGATGAFGGITHTNNGPMVNCLVSGGTGIGFIINSTKVIGCVASGMANIGFNVNNGGAMLVNCIALNCTANNPGFSAASSPNVFANCTSYGHSGGSSAIGFSTQGQLHYYVNCVSYGNSGFGFQLNTANTSRITNCAAGSNALGNLSSAWTAAAVSGFVSLTTNPFVNAAGLDFSANTSAGGGALLRSSGYPSILPGLATTNYPDVGAAQHSDGSVTSGPTYSSY